MKKIYNKHEQQQRNRINMKNKRMNSWLTIVAIGVAAIVGTAGPMALDGYAQTTTTNVVLVRSETPFVIGERLVITHKSVGTAQIGDCAPPGEYNVQAATAIDRPEMEIIEVIPLVDKRLRKGTVIRPFRLVQICDDANYLHYEAEIIKQKIKKHTHPPQNTVCELDDEPEED